MIIVIIAMLIVILMVMIKVEQPLVDCSALKAKHHEGVGETLPG